jgi:hypothetical protein
MKNAPEGAFQSKHSIPDGDWSSNVIEIPKSFENVFKLKHQKGECCRSRKANLENDVID